MAEKEDEQTQEQEEQELEVPAFIDERIDVKAATVVSMQAVMQGILEENDEEASPPVRCSLLTSFGIVEGTLVTDLERDGASQEQRYVVELYQRSIDVRNDELQKTADEMENEPIIVNNVGAILMENVTITPYSNPEHKLRVGHLYLFSDQIAGLTATV